MSQRTRLNCAYSCHWLQLLSRFEKPATAGVDPGVRSGSGLYTIEERPAVHTCHIAMTASANPIATHSIQRIKLKGRGVKCGHCTKVTLKLAQLRVL